METVRLAIGSVAVDIMTDLPDLAAFAMEALRCAGKPEATQCDPVATIVIERSTELGNPWEHLISEARPFPFEDDIVYYHLADGSGYVVTAWDTAFGHLDFKSNMARWRAPEALLHRSAVHLMMLDPLSLFLPPHGIMIGHGAAIAGEAGAGLIFGASGYGKSTLSFLLTHEHPNDGYRLLADDTVVLDGTGDEVIVYAIRAGYGLTREFTNRFGVSMEDGNVLLRAKGKEYLRAVPRATDTARPVHSLLFLDKDDSADDETVIERLNGGSLVHRLLGTQTSIPNPGMAAKVTLNARLASQSTGWRIRYSRWPDTEVIRPLLGHARETVF